MLFVKYQSLQNGRLVMSLANHTTAFVQNLLQCIVFVNYNTVSLPDSPIATLGQGPLACRCDALSLLQLHKRTQRAFN